MNNDLTIPADPQEEIKVLREANRVLHEVNKRLRRKANKWDALGEEIGKYYPDTEVGEEKDFDDSEGLIGIGETAARAFGYL